MSIFQLKIGDIDCAILQEGAAFMQRAEVAQRYPNATVAEVEAAIGAGPPDGSLNLPLLQSGGTRILVDVGFGADGPPGMGGVLRGLDGLGLAAADIDIIYLTHFHGDHIAGLFDEAGAPVYANARYITMQAEWDEWQGRWAASGSAADQRQLERFNSLRDRFSFVSAGDEIAPGVTVVDLAGHTQGHSGLLVEADGQRLLHVVDLLHQSFQFKHVDWHFSFDSDGARATATRKRVLRRCVEEDILTLFYHLGFPGLGKVRLEAGQFVWQPIA